MPVVLIPICRFLKDAGYFPEDPTQFAFFRRRLFRKIVFGGSCRVMLYRPGHQGGRSASTALLDEYLFGQPGTHRVDERHSLLYRPFRTRRSRFRDLIIGFRSIVDNRVVIDMPTISDRQMIIATTPG